MVNHSQLDSISTRLRWASLGGRQLHDHRSDDQQHDTTEEKEERPDHGDAGARGELLGTNASTLARDAGLDEQHLGDRVSAFFRLDDRVHELVHLLARNALAEILKALPSRTAELQLLKNA